MNGLEMSIESGPMESGGLPRAFGGAVLQAMIRSTPDDFIVEEDLGFAPSGSGEHLFLIVEKRGANTSYVAKKLARWASVAEMAVSYAGMKDRHALTRQAFTVHLPKKIAPDFSTLEPETEFRVLSHTWHAKKLPKGALRGNRFVLTLRNVQGKPAAIEQRLQQIAARGVPNWFGEQRFGRDGGNVEAAKAMFAGQRMQRDQRSILLSAARSHLFNRILAERIARGAWDVAMPGEVFALDGSRSVFGPEPDIHAPELAERIARFDIHPSGALWGAGELRSVEAVRELEAAIAASEPAITAGLESADLAQERRALRLPVREFAWCWQGDDVLELRFFLPAGAYATAVLQELI